MNAAEGEPHRTQLITMAGTVEVRVAPFKDSTLREPAPRPPDRGSTCSGRRPPGSPALRRPEVPRTPVAVSPNRSHGICRCPKTAVSRSRADPHSAQVDDVKRYIPGPRRDCSRRIPCLERRLRITHMTRPARTAAPNTIRKRTSGSLIGERRRPSQRDSAITRHRPSDHELAVPVHLVADGGVRSDRDFDHLAGGNRDN